MRSWEERCSYGIHHDSVINYPNAEMLTACSIHTAHRGAKCGHRIWPIEADSQHLQLFPLAQTSYTAQSLAHLQFSGMYLTCTSRRNVVRGVDVGRQGSNPTGILPV